jgi:hypothetical protein
MGRDYGTLLGVTMNKLSLNKEGTARLIGAIRVLMQLAEVMIPGDGEDRRAFVISQINALIDIPFVPESTEEKMIGMIVDTVHELIGEFD